MEHDDFYLKNHPLKENNSPEIVCKPVLTVKDHAVSGSEFKLFKDQKKGFLFTHPVPGPEELPAYYNSDNYISHSDSRENFKDKMYQWVKQLMLQRKLRWVEQEISGKGNLLDIGAGTGDFLLAAKKRGWKVFGMEPVVQARERAKEKDVALKEDLSQFPEKFFDVITLWHVLEHVPDLERHLKNILPLLKPTGIIVIAVPNYKSYDASFYKEYWAAYDVPRHLYHFSRRSLAGLFVQFDFEVIKERGLPFDSFYVSLLSEQYKNGRINWFRSIAVGLLSNLKALRTGEFSSVTFFLRKR